MSIKILDDNLINKIAAGEVVERPSSVVKELVENSIDAGATQITVEIATGGISMIRIADNGKGITANEVYSAFTRHATSKISSFEDLEEVLTLGFRGEALASIASVSQVEMITKQEDAIIGRKIEIHGGKLISEEDIGANNGTTIIVRNLFFNTPARRKFLKKPATESSYITEIINRLALGNPSVSFRYIVNNSEILYTNGNGDLKTVILNILGKETAKNLVAIDFNKNGFGLNGFVCKPQISRGNRSYGNFFINGRFIKSDIVQQAALDAFKTRLPIGKFPIFVLSLSIDPKMVDVNVHPTKLEVRFENEDEIYDICKESIDKALMSEVLIQQHEAKVEPPENPFKSKSIIADTLNFLYEPKAELEKPSFVTAREVETPVYEVKKVEEKAIIPKQVEKAIEKPVKKNTFFANYRIIGQFFYTYWIIQQGSSVYLIDQHAAHERILYEEMYNKLKNEKVDSQRLLQPVVFDFSEAEKIVVEENLDLFENFGFELEKLDEEKYVLNAVPFIFKGPVSSSFFMDIVDKLGEKVGSSEENIYDTKFENIVSMACKKAVKGNDKLNFLEAKELIERLLNLENPFTCPHGRPTIIELTRTEVEKMFKRIQ